MEHKHCNEECMTCAEAWNTLNGRWCGRMGRYVEYADGPPCGKEKK